MKRLLLLLALLVMIPVAAEATNHYMAPAGTDAGDCSNIAAPCATFKYAIDSTRLLCGDTLFIRAGTYALTLIDNGNTSISPINGIALCTLGNEVRVKAYPGETVTQNDGTFGVLISLAHPVGASLNWIFGDSDGTWILDGINGLNSGYGGNGSNLCAVNMADVTFQYMRFTNMPDGFGCFSNNHPGIKWLNNIFGPALPGPYWKGLIDPGSGPCGAPGNFGGAVGTCWVYPLYITGTDDIVEGNEFYNFCSYGIHVFSSGASGAGNNIVRNNYFHDYGTHWLSGITYIYEGGGGTYKCSNQSAAVLLYSKYGHKAYNNKIVDGGPFAFALSVNGGDTTKGQFVYENTVVDVDSFAVSTNPAFAPPAFGTMTIQNNIYIPPVATGGNFLLNSNYVTYVSGGNLCNTTGVFDNGNFCNVFGNPNFQNSPTDLHISSGSDALDIGISLGSPYNVDYDGVTRPKGAGYDAGAFELDTGAPGDTTPPSVSITSPSNGTTVGSTITVGANASDNIAVIGVQFKLDGSNLGSEDTTLPYAVSWDTTAVSNASHTLAAVARDAAGNMSTDTITITVNNPLAGLVSHWALDDGSGTTAADSADSNPATLVNGPTWISGTLSGGVHFDGGASQYAVVPTYSAAMNLGEFTFSFWMRTTSSATSGLMDKRWGPGGDNTQFTVWMVNGHVQIFDGNVFTTYREVISPAAYNDGGWHLVTAIRAGASDMLYMDGALVGTQTAPALPNLTSTGYVFFAVLSDNTNPSSAFYTGDMDDVRLYNRALSAGDVAGLYSSPSITTNFLPAGIRNVAYSQTVVGTGGSTPYAWSIASGALPTGLSINSGSGAITGTPTAAALATYNFTVRLTDNIARTFDQPLSIFLDGPIITTTSLPDGTVSTAYSESVVATGGSGSKSYSVVSGALPTGLSLNGSSGAITGTPTVAGVYSPTFRATDDATNTYDKNLPITISTASGQVAITSTTIIKPLLNQSYTLCFAATGGQTPYTWTISAGSLPSGLSLVSNCITGTATVIGDSSVTIRVAGTDLSFDTLAFSFSVIANSGGGRLRRR